MNCSHTETLETLKTSEPGDSDTAVLIEFTRNLFVLHCDAEARDAHRIDLFVERGAYAEEQFAASVWYVVGDGCIDH